MMWDVTLSRSFGMWRPVLWRHLPTFRRTCCLLHLLQSRFLKRFAAIRQNIWYHIAVDSHIVMLGAINNFIGLPTFCFSKYIELFSLRLLQQNRKRTGILCMMRVKSVYFGNGYRYKHEMPWKFIKVIWRCSMCTLLLRKRKHIFEFFACTQQMWLIYRLIAMWNSL